MNLAVLLHWLCSLCCLVCHYKMRLGSNAFPRLPFLPILGTQDGTANPLLRLYYRERGYEAGLLPLEQSV